MKVGKVFLVGAGPGDEGLITVKGLKAIQKADVILYDRLINPKLLESAKGNCELIYSGKLPKKHILKQERINEYLVEKALEGNTVVRLKGGDPAVFGRVGEEVATLIEQQIPFEIIPGVTSGVAAAMYAGIPITHREYGVSFAIVSAHDPTKDGKSSVHWEGLVNGVDTIAFYMGVANISTISENLIRYGKPASTPVALIQWGTYGRQQVLEGTLATIADKVIQTGFKNPAITLVGDIVSLRQQLKWFENKPLFGRQFLLVRTGVEKSRLASELKDQGADVIELPRWKSKKSQIDEDIINQIGSYHRILFKSPECIDEFFDHLKERELDFRRVQAKLYCISIKSLAVLKKRGLIGYIAQEMTSEGKLLIIGDQQIETTADDHVGENGQYDYLQMFTKEIDYQFVPVIKQMLVESDIDTVIFPSRSSVEVLLTYGQMYGLDVDVMLKKSKICCMGPSSSDALLQHGHNVDIIASEPTISAVIEGLK